MTSVHETAGRAFADRLRSEYPEGVDRVILFGSAARGEARGRESDVDVLVTVSGPDGPPRERIHELVFEVTMEHGVTVTPHVVSEVEYADRSMPLFESVSSEGVAL